MHGWLGLVSLDVRAPQVRRRQAVEEQRQLAVSARMISRTRGRIGMMRLGPLKTVRFLDVSLIIGLSVPPVSTPPPVFLSFGMPPAKRPASCGAASMGAAGASRLPWSLLLLALLPGTGGARPPGAFGKPGTGGAPPTGDGPGPPDTFPITGADRSFVTAFFKAFPLEISERRAPLGLC